MTGKKGRTPCATSPHPEASREADLVQQLVLVAMQLQEPRRKDCAPFMLGLVAVELADCTQPNTHTHAVGDSLSEHAVLPSALLQFERD